MKKSSGFTLIELIVSIAIMAIIMGALVQLFGTSVKAEITGFNQQEMYAQARQVENELKTTLRYLSDERLGVETLKFFDGGNKLITSGDRREAEKLEYEAIIYNLNRKCNQKVIMVVQWSETGEQIIINKKILEEKIVSDTTKWSEISEYEIKFPEHENNTLFGKNEYKRGKYFPVTVIASEQDIHEGMLQIKLPFKYEVAGNDYKINVLETKVAYCKEVESGSYILSACINAKSDIWNGRSQDIRNYDTVTGVYGVDYYGDANNICKDSTKASNLKLEISDDIWPTTVDEVRIVEGNYDNNIDFKNTNSIRIESKWGGPVNMKNIVIEGDENAVLQVASTGNFNQVTFKGPLTVYFMNQNNNLNFENCRVIGDVIMVVNGISNFSKLNQSNKDDNFRLALLSSGQLTLSNCFLETGCVFMSSSGQMIIKGGSYSGQMQGLNINIQKAEGGSVTLLENKTALEHLNIIFDEKNKFRSISFAN